MLSSVECALFHFRSALPELALVLQEMDDECAPSKAAEVKDARWGPEQGTRLRFEGGLENS